MHASWETEQTERTALRHFYWKAQRAPKWITPDAITPDAIRHIPFGNDHSKYSQIFLKVIYICSKLNVFLMFSFYIENSKQLFKKKFFID